MAQAIPTWKTGLSFKKNDNSSGLQQQVKFEKGLGKGYLREKEQVYPGFSKLGQEGVSAFECPQNGPFAFQLYLHPGTLAMARDGEFVAILQKGKR